MKRLIDRFILRKRDLRRESYYYSDQLQDEFIKGIIVGSLSTSGVFMLSMVFIALLQ